MARAVEKFYLQPDGNRIGVLAPTDLEIRPGNILALLGPSGSGKSTLLRMLTGLSVPSSGEVLWHGQPLAKRSPNAAIVFQSFALFPWLNVLENVEAPLEAKGMAAIERRKRALKILDTVGLDGFETAYPKELSGGMKQRVGFARALVVEPEVLFMDEPFSALDVLTAENLRGELMELWLNKKMPTSAIFIVTHNIEEAVLLADRVVVLGKNPGRVRADFEIALPHPRNRKAAPFVEFVDRIYEIMTQPDMEYFAEAVPMSAGSSPSTKPKYQMLPHARPGGIAGLMELLHDGDGREDLYRLATRLSMDVDDLLPIVESCVMLGFATLKEGEAQITPEGGAFADANILTRKVLFRAAALKRVTILQCIDSVLRAKSDHSIPDEFFRDILDEHFTQDEVDLQFNTAMVWGRYAEIFDHDPENGRLILTDSPTEQADAANPGAT
ncbi:MAG TPA: nitrate/sulfonate/bicarbonate ABC transporter ATP-binding protein [Terriglobales bacterium]|jgi:NitT/TauT family transport system ATP-binding protein|nr:nitrate/sulfonate/bicarbonate ABC transporter ATP-binding protein [Terriglobales bacterium]